MKCQKNDIKSHHVVFTRGRAKTRHTYAQLSERTAYAIHTNNPNSSMAHPYSSGMDKVSLIEGLNLAQRQGNFRAPTQYNYAR